MRHRQPVLAYFFMAFFAMLLLKIPAHAAVPPQILDQASPSLAPMLKRVMPAVVNIATVQHVQSMAEDDYENRSQPQNKDPRTMDLPPRPNKLSSLGSGVIVNAEHGYILTNAHVVHKAKSIQVKLGDGRIADARLIGTDRASDVAVLQIKEKNLTAIALGNSENLNVGDFVVAIGNPFGLAQSASSGIVSALQRSNLHIVGSQSYENFIQTDAPINPGNSGGALINLKGELIGINTAILGTDGSNIGIGFAIPVNMAISVMRQLIDHGNVSRGLLGILSQSPSADLVRALNLKTNEGAIVTFVAPHSPAANRGVQIGDVITKLNGKIVKDSFQLRNMIGLLQIGDHVELEFIRKGKKHSVTMVIADPKKQEKASYLQEPFFYGLALRHFDQQLPGMGRTRGVQVLAVLENSPATKANIRPGDVILSVNHKNVTSLEELQALAEQYSGNELILRMLRESGVMFVVVKRI